MKYPTSDNIVPHVSIPDEDVLEGLVLDMFRENPTFALAQYYDSEWHNAIAQPIPQDFTDTKWVQRYTYLVQKTDGSLCRLHFYNKTALSLNQSISCHGIVTNDKEDIWEDMPSFHATSIDPPMPSLDVLHCTNKRDDVITLFNQVFQSNITSEMVLLFLMSNDLPLHQNMDPIHFSFINVQPIQNEDYFVSLLHNLCLSIHSTSLVTVPESALHDSHLFPKEVDERIRPNAIFPTPTSYFLLHEPTVLTKPLSEMAMTNARCFQDLFQGKNTFVCEHANVQASCPLAIATISPQLSMLRKLTPLIPIKVPDLSQAYYNGTTLTLSPTMISYIKSCRQHATFSDQRPFTMSSEAETSVQAYFVKKRQGQFDVDDLHQFLYLCRLYCRSHNLSHMDNDMFKRMEALNDERLK